MHQVVIVGAGPIGSYLAALLSQKGIQTLLIEEHKTVGKPVHCTGIIGCQTFDRFDVSRDSIVDSINTISLISPSGAKITCHREKPLAYVVCRTTYDRYIAQKAIDSGTELRLGVRVKTVEQDEKAVTLYCNNGETLRSQICVMATGSLSNLPFRMGIGNPKKFMLGAQIVARLSPLDHTEVYVNQEFAPGFFAWAVPVGEEGLCRVGLCAPDNSSEYLKHFLDRLSSIKNLDLQGEKPAFSRIPVGMCKRSYLNRIVALGDAASQVKPTTGGGLTYGLQCAQTLSESITHQVLERAWNPHHFKSYEGKWKKILGRELRTGYFFKELITRTSNQRLDQIIQELKKDNLYNQIFPHADFDHHSRMILKMLANPLLTGLFLASVKDWAFGKIFAKNSLEKVHPGR